VSCSKNDVGLNKCQKIVNGQNSGCKCDEPWSDAKPEYEAGEEAQCSCDEGYEGNGVKIGV
jgi:hypothetical protein